MLPGLGAIPQLVPPTVPVVHLLGPVEFLLEVLVVKTGPVPVPLQIRVHLLREVEVIKFRPPRHLLELPGVGAIPQLVPPTGPVVYLLQARGGDQEKVANLNLLPKVTRKLVQECQKQTSGVGLGQETLVTPLVPRLD